jgi:flagellar hook-length control protein FliK
MSAQDEAEANQDVGLPRGTESKLDDATKEEALTTDEEPAARESVTQAQLAWLLAQLAGLGNVNGPALPIDGPGSATGTEVHSTAVADLSRLVSARALVATTVGTTGTPTPQATNEVAATNVQAQEFSALLANANMLPPVTESQAPVVTEVPATASPLPKLGQGAQVPAESETHQLSKGSVLSAQTVLSSKAQVDNIELNSVTESPAPVPNRHKADVPSAMATEIGAAENQAGRGVVVRNQTASIPRQPKVEGGPSVGDKLTVESGRAELQSVIAESGKGEANQFETEDRQSPPTDRMNWQGGNGPTPHETRADGTQASLFTVHGQEVSTRTAGEAKSVPTGSIPPADVEQPVKPTGTPTIRLEVSPPDMGRVQVRVSVSDHSVYTNVLTDQAGVRDLLLRQQDRLQDALGAYGLGMGSFNVEVGQQGQQRSEWGGQPDPHTLARLAEDVPTPDAQTAVSTEWDDRGLNLFA